MNLMKFRVESTRLEESNFHIWVSLNATRNSWRLHRTNQSFVCEHLSVCLHNPFSWKAVCCIHHPHRKHEQDQWLLEPLLYLFSGKVVQVSPFFASVLLQIESNTLKYSEPYFCDQESRTKVNICNFSVFEVVTNFSFIAACSLSSSSTLFLVSLSYIGDGSSISISKTLYAAEMFSLYTFKTFFNLPLVLEARLCWATPWILTGETPMLLRVKLSFFFGESYSKKSSSDANPSCKLCLDNLFSFLGGLVNFSYLVAHCLHNFWPGYALLNPFSFSILVISKLITLWALLLQWWYFKILQHLSAFFSNTFPKNCSWWK